MTTHNATLDEPFFSMVRDGTKIFEVRPQRGEWEKLTVGGQIRFASKTGKAPFVKKITNITGFRNFEDAVAEHGTALMPNLETRREVLEAYLKIGDYGKWEGPILMFTLSD